MHIIYVKLLNNKMNIETVKRPPNMHVIVELKFYIIYRYRYVSERGICIPVIMSGMHIDNVIIILINFNFNFN